MKTLIILAIILGILFFYNGGFTIGGFDVIAGTKDFIFQAFDKISEAVKNLIRDKVRDKVDEFLYPQK